MPMALAPLPDKWLGKLDSALSRMLSASSLRMTRPAFVQLCVLSSVIGLAQAAPVDLSPRTPVPEHKTCNIFLPILFSCFLVAFLVAVWWVRRRATRRATDRGSPAPRTPSTLVSIPSLAYLRPNRSVALPITSGAPQAVLNMANTLTATPIGRPGTRISTSSSYSYATQQLHLLPIVFLNPFALGRYFVCHSRCVHY